jgi:hypothetical protein
LLLFLTIKEKERRKLRERIERQDEVIKSLESRLRLSNEEDQNEEKDKLEKELALLQQQIKDLVHTYFCSI